MYVHNMGFIYRLTSPSNKSYIGQTFRPIEKRFKEHQDPDSPCVAISRAIQKHGWDNMKKKWIEIPDEDLNFYEEMLVALLGTLAPGGYNLKEGGGNGKPCEEVRKKISIAQTGKTLTDDHKQKLSAANIGKTLSNDHKQKLSAAHTGKTLCDDHKQKISVAISGNKNPFHGKTHTDEVKQKISESLTGRTLTDEHTQNISDSHKGDKNHRSKTVYQYDFKDTYVKSFVSSEDAARSLNKKFSSSISECARGIRKSAYGFKWSFTEL
ncbi:GIY-YIG catalytic domain-containing endonuclease [Acanthocystis turfacea Chlorella virus OR0704.3]|nr:GIY-YIG catalytic domain-containing endonuclease [Acanthocystis turfacea Chlorella virus OR0704.3]